MANKKSRKYEKAMQEFKASFPDRTDFYLRESKRFYDNNLIKLLYDNGEFAFCNYANNCYIYFPYRFSQNVRIVDKSILIYAIRNPLEYLIRTSENKEYCVNDVFFEKAKATKEKTDAEGPTELVDLRLDEMILRYGRDIPQSVYDEYLLNK